MNAHLGSSLGFNEERVNNRVTTLICIVGYMLQLRFLIWDRIGKMINSMYEVWSLDL